MRSYLSFCVALFGAALVAATSASAHHSYVPKYNPAKRIQLKGVISSVSYTNPHIFFTVDVPLKSGGTVSWTIETESISLSRKKGLTRAKMPIGGRVTVTGWQSRSGGPAMGLATYRLRRGRTITIRRTPR